MIPKLHQYQIDNNVTAFSTMRSCDENSLQAEGKVNDAYALFNINPWVGDSEEQVKNNRLELAKALEINEKTSSYLTKHIKPRSDKLLLNFFHCPLRFKACC